MEEYIRKIKVLKDITGIAKKDEVYNLEDFKNKYPFIDVNNKEYFAEHFEFRFEIGDKVQYSGNCRGVSNKAVYTIVEKFSTVWRNKVTIEYRIKNPNENGNKTVVVKESELSTISYKWTISFSQASNTDMPGVHQIDSISAEKLKHTWKKIFIFETQGEAIEVAKFFASHTIKEIMVEVNGIESLKKSADELLVK